MAITSATKIGDDIVYVEDGVTKRFSITGYDMVASFPLSSCDRIVNMWRQQSDGHLIVAYIDTNGDTKTVDLDPVGGSGDMLKSVYDTNGDGIVDQAASLENGELVLTPKAAAVGGAEGTIFYDSDDDHVYVATL